MACPSNVYYEMSIGTIVCRSLGMNHSIIISKKAQHEILSLNKITKSCKYIRPGRKRGIRGKRGTREMFVPRFPHVPSIKKKEIAKSLK